MTSTTTSHSREIKRMQADMLEATKQLQAAIKDPNALMAGGDILGCLQQLEQLRNEYSTLAWDVHIAWVTRNYPATV